MTDPFVPPSSHRRWRMLWLWAALCLLGGVRAEARDIEAEPFTLRTLGEYWLQRAALSKAEVVFQKALARNLLDGAARTGLAELCIERTEPDAALAHLALARVTTTPVSESRIARLRAKALLLLGRSAAAQDAVQAGLRADPFDAELVEAAAEVAFRSGDIDRSVTLYARAATMDPSLESANLRMGSGFGRPIKGTPWRTPPQAEQFREAVAAWEAGELAAAQGRFAALVQRWPDNFKFRLGLGMSILERRLEFQIGNNKTERYRRLPTLEIPMIDAFIPQWGELSDEARHVIGVAISPAARWVPILVGLGARHDVLSWEALLTDASERADYDRTPDGRRWRQLRGVGGKQAATGVEKLRLAARFGFNVFAHEFAHQLLSYGFEKRHAEEVRRLYLDALEAGRCLDYYAASNIDEYFAQGYEAFISLRKNGRLRETSRHTRAELKRNDPALHAFLERVLDRSHETRGSLAPFWNAGSDK